jgi:hypothetical protein
LEEQSRNAAIKHSSTNQPNQFDGAFDPNCQTETHCSNNNLFSGMHGEENVMSSVSEHANMVNHHQMTIHQEMGSALDKSIDRSFECNMVNMSQCYNNFGGHQNESQYMVFSEQTPNMHAMRNNNTLNISRVGGLFNPNEESIIEQADHESRQVTVMAG